MKVNPFMAMALMSRWLSKAYKAPSYYDGGEGTFDQNAIKKARKQNKTKRKRKR